MSVPVQGITACGRGRHARDFDAGIGGGDATLANHEKPGQPPTALTVSL